MSYRVVAIEREYASGGLEVGERLGKLLGLPCYGQEILKRAAAKLNVSPEAVRDMEENLTGSLLYSLAAMTSPTFGSRDSYLSPEQQLAVIEGDVIRSLAYEPCIIVGRGAAALLKNKANVLRVFIHGEPDFRAQRAVQNYGLDAAHTESLLHRYDKQRASYFKIMTKHDWKDTALYHLFLNSGLLGVEQAAHILERAYKQGGT